MSQSPEKAFQKHLRASGVQGWHAPKIVSGEAKKTDVSKAPVKPSAMEDARQASLKASGVENFVIKNGT